MKRRRPRRGQHLPAAKAGLSAPQPAHAPAFTLIELLVVIAVIALLMAILMPVLSRARNQARAMACQSNLRQWGTTLALYAEDNQGHLPYGQTGRGAVWLLRGALPSGYRPNAPEDSFRHFRTKGIACCPMAVRPAAGDPETFRMPADFADKIDAEVHGTYGCVFEAWELTSPAPAFHGSYGVNQRLFSSRCEVRIRRPSVPTNIFMLRGRAKTPVLLDSASPCGAPGERERPPRRQFHGGGPGIHSFCLNRHSAHVNGLFLDWSVRRVGLKELWTLKWHPRFNTAGPWTRAGGVQPEDWPQWMRGSKDY